MLKLKIHHTSKHTKNKTGLPMTHGLHVFDALEQKSPPLSLSCAWNWPSKLASKRCVYSLKFCTMRHPEKVGTVSPSSDTGTTHLTLVKVPCCQLTYVLHVFKHCDLLVLKIIILWEAMCITLNNQNPNTTFKIRFWVFPQGLWRAGSSEHRVIPSKLMKRGWKYPLKHQEGGEGTPLKDSKLGALRTDLSLYQSVPVHLGSGLG